ncbi:MAG: ester cyclase [Thermomicrobiales bacterium]
MKPRHLLTAALALASLAGSPLASAQNATPTTVCAAMSDTDSRAVADAFMATLNARDLSGFDAIVAPNAVFGTRTAESILGPAGFMDALGGELTTVPDVTYIVEQTIADGQIAVIRWTATGSPATEDDPSGEPHAWTGMFLLRNECGKIGEATSAVDQLAQLGGPGEKHETLEPAAAYTSEPCEEASEDTMRQTVDQLWNDAWNSKDLDAYRDLVTPGVVQHWSSGDDTAGVDASTERLHQFFLGIPDLQLAWQDIAAESDIAAAAWTLTGTNTGDLFGAPATGKPIAYSGINMFRFECGKIAEVWSEGDILRLRQELGQ